MTGSEQPRSDDALVEEARTGDMSALEGLMRRHNRRMYRAARAVLGDASEAEDSVQDAYVKAFTRIDQFRSGRFDAWIVTIVLNEARARRRRRVRHAQVLRDGGADVLQASADGVESDPERAAVQAEARAMLEQAIDQLPDNYREVFVLRELESMSTRETAELLAIEPGTVKVRLHRARTQLRQLLSDRIAAAIPGAFEFAGARCDRIVSGVVAALRRDGRIAH